MKGLQLNLIISKPLQNPTAQFFKNVLTVQGFH